MTTAVGRTPARHARASWKDAYDAQMGLWRWERSPVGQAWLLQHFRDNSEGLSDHTRKMLAGLYEGEVEKVLGATPFAVSAEMCDVVETASQSFAPEPILPTDLLAAAGFVYFDRPFEVPDRFQRPISIQAVAWTPLLNAANELEAADLHERGLSKGDALPTLVSRYEARTDRTDGLSVTLYEADDGSGWVPGLSRPPLCPLHVCPWWFGMTFEGNEVDENGKPTGAAWWWRLVQTTFRLMQQQIAHRTSQRPERPQRREATRIGFPEREVIVVRLRREASERHEPSGEEAGYSHRFIVGGHWRNQWYPTAQVHRQIWISPYVKGPEDAPLVVRPRRAYVWER